MVPLPPSLEPYRISAEEAISLGFRKKLEFSRETYQISLQDPETLEDVWVFLQFNERGEAKDHFCSCQESEEKGNCLHQAMAILLVYSNNSLPLHLRFRRSLWHALGKMGLHRYGDDEREVLYKDPDIYFDKRKKKDFLIRLKTESAKESILSILEERPIETEETSIKFSNLSEEELEAWKKGDPSVPLQYDLSYWSDLAKWWMTLQEQGDVSLSFSYDEQAIPNGMHIDFSDLTIDCTLSKEELLKVIPSLPTLPSPLFVRQEKIARLEKIHYDPKRAVLILKKKSKAEQKRKKEEFAKGIPLGKWIYLPRKGFIHTSEPPWMENDEIPTEQIPQMLADHLDVLEDYLDTTPIHRTKRTVKHEIHFDPQWNLHLHMYLFHPGDLKIPQSRDFGDWIYLPSKGFFPIDGRLFPQIETLIPDYHVGEFVRHHRIWLSQYPLYQTHLSAIEGQVAYAISDTGRLSFSRELKKRQPNAITHDFGAYIYVEGEGFYPKSVLGSRTPIRPGTAVGPEQVPLFIHANREELEALPGFFSEQCPLSRAGLKLELTGEDELEVIPSYTPSSDYQGRKLLYFEEYVYTPGEGFFELAGSLRLPEEFRHRVPIPARKINAFFQDTFPKIESYLEWVHPHLQIPDQLVLTAQSLRKTSKGKEEEYAVQMSYQSELGIVPLSRVWKALKQKKRYLFSPAGRIDLQDKRFLWLRKIPEDRLQGRRNLLLLSPLQFIRLHAFEQFELITTDEQAAQEGLTFLQEITHFQTPLPPDQRGFLSHLRPYQQTGLQWLWFLYQHSLSGLLCDEMGLGKTHQAMGLMASITNSFSKQRKSHPQFLVICPTSVLYHWKEKMEEYLPEFEIFTFYGTKRTLGDFTSEHRILLTSYGIWRNERESLQQIPFEAAFFDEIQIAKNPLSRIYHALKEVRSKTKIGLTGTPIENHLRELKTLFDLVLPSYMPSDKEYREIFVKPIEKEESHEKKELLTRFIHPFVLRRKKKDVLVELPEKIEEVAHCDLVEEQERLYRDVLMQGRMQILPHLQDPSNRIPYVHVFALLTQLKQICDHPAVYWKRPEEFLNHPSGKWELFKELLNEALESEQKIVVYSQYLHMLDIIEMYLEGIDVSYAALRGSTVDRGSQISRFHKDPQCRVFVGSLHAAGLGIDLTPASVVIHYDRWWNAARENQATDRVHRIGQKKGVQVFKLVTLNSFEERIDYLIQKKHRLLEDIVGIDDKDVIKTFTKEDILQLLDYVEKEEGPSLFEES